MGDASQVVIFKEWVVVPVFHVFDRERHNPRLHHAFGLEDGWTRITKRWLSACGRTLSEWGWEEFRDEDGRRRTRNHRDSGRSGIVLRRDHAEAFARPCERCARVEEIS